MRLRTAIAVCFVVAGCDENEPQGVPGGTGNRDFVPENTVANGASSTGTSPSGSGAQGNGGSGGAGAAGAGGDAQGGAGGAGGAPPEGAFSIAPSSFVDLGGTVQLRVLRTEDDGSVTEITDEAALDSLSPDILTFVDGRAVGVAGGTATVHIVHDGYEALGEVRVRHWTHLDDFPEPGTPAGRAVGFDGSVLHSARNDETSKLQLWYAAPSQPDWRPVAEGSAVGAVPLGGGRYLVPTPYSPEPFPSDLEPAILGTDLDFTAPTPALGPLLDVRDGAAYGFGRCALILHDGGRKIQRWCENGETNEVEWPRSELGTAALYADEAGRVGLVEEAGETVRALVEDGDGGWAELILDAPDRASTSMVLGPDGEGWVAWSSETGDSGIVAARITASGFEEPEQVSLVGERSALAMLPDARTVLYWFDSSPPPDLLPRGAFVLPDGPSLDSDGVLFGGAGGLVTLVDFVTSGEDTTEEVWSTDGEVWSATHAIEACRSDDDGFAGSTPGGGFVRARFCDAWAFDAYR